ncbi:hypothetical protein A1Q2_04327 [Trichosporon asahii var. asahii CBS 8904]|uniref:Deoxyuridine 5'-triphosphate nucleotidohydrolase n=1 Tax=Trichosporon asahii var. asahii (strain CBS 8904) TaxID=1220162 RepID=K1VBG7_TRIAC|nr:hypothetical protein A1Q2_04327 [Trichosporon asahii var. asahii CBS 8904]
MVAVSTPSKTPVEGKKATAKLPSPPPQPVMLKNAGKAAEAACACAKSAMPMRVKRLAPSATIPTRGSALAAGFDLYASRPASVPPRGKAMVDTDISIALPSGTYGRVAPRSGLAAKHSIHTGAGVIDADYRGPLKVILFNLGDEEFKVNEGDRIAQLILEEVRMAPALEVEDLDETVRGQGGFGSTGVGAETKTAPPPEPSA